MKTLPEVWRPDSQPDFVGPVLLDTHIWVWYLDGAGERMAASGVELVRQCLRGEGALVSDMSVWEVGTKVARGKLTLKPNVSSWLERASRRPGFSFLSLDREILLLSTQLPGAIHGDPVDRILVASSALAGFPIVTADHMIVDYARSEGGFSACDVRR